MSRHANSKRGRAVAGAVPAAPPEAAVRVVIDGVERFCAAGTPAGELARFSRGRPGLPYIACLVNHDVCSLTYPLDVNATVRFLTMTDTYGMRVYRDSITFLLARAIAGLFPGARYQLEHSFGSGFYCSFELDGKPGISPAALRRLDGALRDIVRRNRPIERRKVAFMEAVRIFEADGQTDRLNLLRFMNPPKIVTYWCDGYSDLAHGPIAPSTGPIRFFKIVPYAGGFVLQIPERSETGRIPPFRDRPKLFQIFRDHKNWGRTVGVSNVGRLNELIASKSMGEFVKMSESFHEKKIAGMADRICLSSGRVRAVFISGPSGAGKTTFSKRLGVQLQVNGIRPIMISLDDYYVSDEDTPRDEQGRPDYEHIDAIDTDLFNRHLSDLLRGREIDLPSFNFETKRREFRGRKLRLAPGQILVVEGIHGLNPNVSRAVPDRKKFKIYISALTQLNIDAHNRISTTDNRIMRRLVRDNLFRGNTALTTLRMWPSVRRGEKRWVFPFQEQADAMFNSALDYELAVLKPFADPLLMEVKPSEPEYAKARRLLQFLSHFLEITVSDVPSTSLLREFVGESSFTY